MDDNRQRVVIELEPGQDDSGRKRRDGALSLTYISLPPLNLEEVDALIETFIQLAGELFGTTTKPADVQKQVEAARTYGGILFDWLTQRMPGLAETINGLSDGDRLSFAGPPEIMAMPWELLYDGRRFVAGDCSVVRLSEKRLADKGLQLAPFPLPLRVLGVTYSSEGLSVAAEDHWLPILDALKPLIKEGLADLRLMTEEEQSGFFNDERQGEAELFNFLGLGQLPADVVVDQVHVLHILAHGHVPEEGGEATINLGGKAYSGQQLADFLLGRFPRLRLVLLASCKSANMFARSAVKSIAQAFLEAQLPAVVAMQYDISLDAAALFMAGLYRTLADGKPLDEAVQEGRREITRLSGSVEWSTPVLYSALDDLSLFAPLSPAERRLRQLYLAALRKNTTLLPEYFPLDVTPVFLDEEMSGDRTTQDEQTRLPPLTTDFSGLSGRRVDVHELLLDDDKRFQRPVTVLLGDTGSGKTAVLDWLIGQLVPPAKNQDGELTTELKHLAHNPAALLPIRLSFQRIGTDEISYQLEPLVRQALAETWARAGDRGISLPSITEVEGWAAASWLFVFILEGMEEIPIADRERVSLSIQKLIQTNPRHYYLLVASAESFLDYASQLGKYPQWQLVPLRSQFVRQFIDDENLRIVDESLIILLQQPWALNTLKAMANQGHITFDQASLLKGRIDRQLAAIPELGREYLQLRISSTLMEAAFSMEQGCHAGLGVEAFFTVMKRVRGQRTYDLEKVYSLLLDAGVLNVVASGEEERVRFQEPYTFAILYALALDRQLGSEPALLSRYDLATPEAGIVLVLLAQLRPENIHLVVNHLLERLAEMDREWFRRIHVLDIVVRCLAHRPERVAEKQRRQIVRELVFCLLKKRDEPAFERWLEEQPLIGLPGRLEKVDLDALRVRQTNLRVRVVELLAGLKDPAAYELLRWFVMEPKDPRMPERLAHRRLRQTAAQQLRQQWPDGIAEDNTTLADFLQDYLLLKDFLEAWTALRSQEAAEDDSEFNRLVGFLNSDALPWLNTVSAVALADVGGRQPVWTDRAIRTLADRFQEATDPDMLWILADSLSLLRYLPPDSSELAQMLIDVSTGRQINEAMDGNDKLQKVWRETAIYALAQLRSPLALLPLLEILGDETQDFRLRARAAQAVGQIGVEFPDNPNLAQARDVMRRVARTDDWPGKEARKSLGYLGDQETLDELETSLTAAPAMDYLYPSTPPQ